VHGLRPLFGAFGALKPRPTNRKILLPPAQIHRAVVPAEAIAIT